MTRRTLLQNGCAALTALRAQGMRMPDPKDPEAGALSIGSKLRKYVDRLPIPPILPSVPGRILPIELRAFQHKVHRDLPPTIVWGYNGMWPGPTIAAKRGEPIQIKWTSKLPAKHLLPIDNTIHGAEASLPEVRTVAHVHGAAVSPDSDGHPDAWFTTEGKTGPAFKGYVNEYLNDQPGATLWYHDHTMGITRLNVYAGLSGFYLLHDETETRLNLPCGDYDIPLMLQDRQFQADGTLLYPKAVNGTHPVWIQEFFSDVICVNGKAMPYLEVEPRKYRFRILNASNARFYHLRLFLADAEGNVGDKRADVPVFQQIGTDGGLLPAPLSLHYLLIGNAERFDVVIDFSEFAGKAFTLANDAPAPYTMGGQTIPGDVLLFKVNKPLSQPDHSQVPDELVPFEALDPASAERERVLPLTEKERASDGYVAIGLVGNARWHDPVTENPRAGATEIWSFANTTMDVHPMHLHLVRFQVLDRQAFDVPTYLQSGKIVFTGRPIAPETNERPAWKDTVKAYPGYLTRTIQRFDLPNGMATSPGQEHKYVWHCHMLEHEDNEMMRPYVVVS